MTNIQMVEPRPNALNRLIDAICFRLIHGTLRSQPNFQINKLKLSAGDVLVVRVNDRITKKQAADIRDLIEPRLPVGVRSMVIDKALDLSVFSAPVETKGAA